MFKKITSIILSLAIFMGIFACLPISVSAASRNFLSADDYAANFVKQNNFKYTIINDVSGDGKTDALDLIALIKHLLNKNEINVEADFNEDGAVNVVDIVRLKKILSKTV